jgi:hypothetical protein
MFVLKGVVKGVKMLQTQEPNSTTKILFRKMSDCFGFHKVH